MKFFRSFSSSSRRKSNELTKLDKPTTNSRKKGDDNMSSCDLSNLTVDTVASAEGSSGCAVEKNIFNPSARVATKEVKVAKTFFDCIAKADMEGLQKVTHADCRMIFPDIEINPANIAEETEKLARSFPDSHFVYEEVYQKEPNVIFLRLRWAGTHTGPAYGFGPYEEVPTTGKKVVNDPEEITFTLKDGKAYHIVVHPTGPNTGFHGVYLFIGGLII